MKTKPLSEAQDDMYRRTRAVYAAMCGFFLEIDGLAGCQPHHDRREIRIPLASEGVKGVILGYQRAVHAAIERECSLRRDVLPDEFSEFGGKLYKMAQDFWEKRLVEEYRKSILGHKKRTPIPVKELWNLALIWLEWHNKQVEEEGKEDKPISIVKITTMGRFSKALKKVPESTAPRWCKVFFGDVDPQYLPHDLKKEKRKS